MADYPKTLYRGKFETITELHAAWNAQSGIQQKHVNSDEQQKVAEAEGFVENPADMVKMPSAAALAPAKPGRKLDEPLSGNS